MAVPNRDEVRDFLISRRAKVRPDQIALPTGSNRRVPGLRRAEVAMLVSVSVEYYARLERGNLNGVSESVLDGSPVRCSSVTPNGTTRSLARTASTSPGEAVTSQPPRPRLRGRRRARAAGQLGRHQRAARRSCAWAGRTPRQLTGQATPAGHEIGALGIGGPISGVEYRQDTHRK